MILGKLLCWIAGKHKRGVRLKPTDPPHVPGDQNVIRFQCGRCKATWTRKVKREAK